MSQCCLMGGRTENSFINPAQWQRVKIRRMMSSCLIFGAIMVALVAAAPQSPPGEPVAILSQTNDISPEGNYEWSFEAANGIKAEEKGSLKKTNDPENPEAVVAAGAYSYTDPEGNQISLTYTADDEGGFRPVGNHLPTSPPIPPNIQKALEWIAAQPSTTERSGRGRK